MNCESNTTDSSGLAEPFSSEKKTNRHLKGSFIHSP